MAANYPEWALQGTLPDGREFSGSSPSRTIQEVPLSRPGSSSSSSISQSQSGSPGSGTEESIGSVDSWSQGRPPTIATSSSWSPSPERNLSAKLRDCLETSAMQSYQDRPRRMRTSGKTPPEWEIPSNMGRNPFASTLGSTMKPFGRQLNPAIWPELNHVCEWYLTGHLGRLQQIMPFLMHYSEVSMSFGEPQVLVNRVVLGQKRAQTLFLSARSPSFGVVIEVRRMLWLMNFVEESILPTSSDGVIGTRFIWRSKAPLSRCYASESGLPQICIHQSGTRIWTTKPMEPSKEGSP